VKLTAEGKDDDVKYPLLESESLGGATKATYIFPEDGFMSRSHAKVYQRGDSYFLEMLAAATARSLKFAALRLSHKARWYWRVGNC